MKSDTTEMVLLGAAAAVIALVVAFSMMGDKGNKRSLDSDDPVETARNVRGQVRFITRPKSRTMRATRQLMLPPNIVS